MHWKPPQGQHDAAINDERYFTLLLKESKNGMTIKQKACEIVHLHASEWHTVYQYYINNLNFNII